jgi:hypothetical protein
MNELFDPETGEAATVSQSAIEVRKAAIEQPRIYPRGLAVALQAAIAKLPVWITTDERADAGKMNYKYASLKAILATVRPVLLEHGIRIRQGANPSWSMETGGVKGRLVPVYTDLIFAENAEVDTTIVEIPLLRLDPQAMGSALSYGRRYSLLAALGLATDEADDDGKAAKTVDLTEHEVESQELWGLKQEVSALDTVEKLKDWGVKLKASRRADFLSEGDAALLKRHYVEALRRLAEQKAAK